jgi:maltose O-acetyltransferase
MKTQKENMLSGELYNANDPELNADRNRCAELLAEYNTLVHYEEQVRFLPKLVGSTGPASQLRPPFYCDYGYNIHLGEDVFLNFNCVILDVVRVTIGDHTKIGSAVQILAADHPRDPKVRASLLESGKPIRIGRNVWIGSGAMILPGVTIGDDAVIGAGSVVTRDVAPGATVVGNPARPLAKKPRAASEVQ